MTRHGHDQPVPGSPAKNPRAGFVGADKERVIKAITRLQSGDFRNDRHVSATCRFVEKRVRDPGIIDFLFHDPASEGMAAAEVYERAMAWDGAIRLPDLSGGCPRAGADAAGWRHPADGTPQAGHQPSVPPVLDATG